MKPFIEEDDSEVSGTFLSLQYACYSLSEVTFIDGDIKPLIFGLNKPFNWPNPWVFYSCVDI